MKLTHALPILVIVLLSLSACSRHGSPGQMAYGKNCGICHHSGDGMPGEVPPLRGRIDLLAKTPEGRTYLLDVLLNGLSGPIIARGDRYSALMPSFRRLNDADISSILNWLSVQSKTNFDPHFTAEEVHQRRATSESPGGIWEERKKLALTQPIP